MYKHFFKTSYFSLVFRYFNRDNCRIIHIEHQPVYRLKDCILATEHAVHLLATLKSSQSLMQGGSPLPAKYCIHPPFSSTQQVYEFEFIVLKNIVCFH